MDLLIKQRLFSWGDSYYVFDRNGEARYEVRSDALSLGRQIRVYTIDPYMPQEEIGCIRLKPSSPVPAFEIDIGKRIVGTIRKNFTPLHQNYELDFCGWKAEGDFGNRNYRVLRGNTEIMAVRSGVLDSVDIYTLRFCNPADTVTGLLLATAIDATSCSHND